MSNLGWHVISGAALLDLLRRARAGDDPDLLYAEEWANADHETVAGTGQAKTEVGALLAIAAVLDTHRVGPQVNTGLAALILDALEYPTTGGTR